MISLYLSLQIRDFNLFSHSLVSKNKIKYFDDKNNGF